ncbi:MAG: hypothetical protein ACREBE_05985 [bacterium]
MVGACEEKTIGLESLCSGRVRLTPQLRTPPPGIDKNTWMKCLLAEARIGCSQKCSCQCASAQLEQVIENGETVDYVVARCSQSPSSLALGHRLKP